LKKQQIHIQELLKRIDYRIFKTRYEDYKKEFSEKHNIKLSEYSGYILCKYDNIISDWIALTKQTRGIVLDSLDDWKVVNFPFTKFFNLHEKDAATINWQSATFQEKLDGSIIFLWWGDRLDKWMISTSGTCNAFNAKTTFGKSFGEIVEDVLKRDFSSPELFYKLLNKDWCYIFELESCYNQIIVDQTDNEGKLTLLGARSLETFQEIDLNSINFDFIKPIELVKRHNLNKYTVKAFVNSRSPKEAEGLVVCDKNFNRIKIKSDEYLRIHRIQGGVISSWKNVLELVLSPILDDARGLLGKLENERIDEMQEKVNKHFAGYIKTLDSVPEICLQNRAKMGQYIKKNNLELYNTFIWQCHFGGKSQLQIFKEQVAKNSSKIAQMLMENY